MCIALNAAITTTDPNPLLLTPSPSPGPRLGTACS